MKSKVSKVICITLAFFLLTQPAFLSAHDFGGPTDTGTAPVGAQAQDTTKGQTGGGQISFFDGSEVFSEADLQTKGYFPIIFSRHYDSRSIYDSSLGYGWSHNYNIRLFTYGDGSAVIRWGNGIKLRFVQTGGSYVSEKNDPGEFRDNGDGTFTFLTPMGMKYEFDIHGSLVQIEDNSGNYLIFSYTPEKQPLTGKSLFSIAPDQSHVVSYSYQLLSIAEGTAGGLTGRLVSLSYDPGTGRLASITNSAGRTVNYEHDVNGNLTRVTYPENLLSYYVYNDPHDIHNLTSFQYGYVDQGADIISTLYDNVYDDQDRVIDQTYAGGSLQIDYTIPMSKTTVTRIIRDGVGAELHNFQNVYEFNADGYVVRFTDEETNQVEYVRDAINNVTRKVIWENKGTVGAPDLDVFRTVDYQYDNASNLTNQYIALNDGEALNWTYTYDHGWLSSSILASSKYPSKKQHLVQEFNYNSDGYPKNIKRQRVLMDISGSQDTRDVEYSYDAAGQLVAVQHENGDRTEYSYTNGLLYGMEGHEFIWSSDGTDNLIEMKRPDGVSGTIEYDNLDRPIRIKNTLNEQTILTYQGWNLVQIERGKTDTQSGYFITYEYDPVGRVISSSKRLESSPYATINYKYDSNDNILDVTNALNQSTRYQYDSKNRLTRITAPNDAYLTHGHDLLGNVISVSDSVNGTAYEYVYDELNRIRQLTDAVGKIISYDYELDNISAITDPKGNTRTFEYNMAGRLIAERMASGKETLYEYDSKGRLSQQRDANGVQTILTYTSNNRISRITVQSTPEHYLSYVYDDFGNLISYTDSVISTAPVMIYTYDVSNRLDTVTNTLINKTLDYDYNRFGLLSGLTVKERGGATFFDCTYEYDSAGRLISMTEGSGRLSSFTYDNIGSLIGIAYPQGSNATISHGTAGWMQSIDYSKADNSPIETFQYNYNGIGELQSITDISGTTTYAYDNQSQVTGVTYPVGSNLTNETYTYDAAGNRLTSSDFSNWSYNADNQLVQFGTTSFTYDNNGNTLSQTETASSYMFQYDALNRLTDTTVSGQNLKFFYDHLGRRIKKEVNGSATWFMYDGYRLIAEFDGSGSLVRHYGYRPGSYAPHSITDDTGYYSILHDRSGVPRRIIDNGEQIVYRGDYQSFGKMVFNDDADGDGNSLTMNLRFAGQYFDAESGLHCNSNRFYDPQTGRFLSIDPVRGNLYQPGELNDYTYCLNNPIGYFDPNGLKKRKRPGFLARHFYDAVYSEYYRKRLDAYTMYYFIAELFTRPVQNVKDAVTGKMGAGIQIFTVTTGAFGTITLLAFGGAWIAIQGGPALVFAKYSGTILSWLSLVTGYNIPQLMQNPHLIPSAVAMSEVKTTPGKDALTIFSNVTSTPTDVPGKIDAAIKYFKSTPGALKFVGNTFDRARRALPDRSNERRLSPYEGSQHPVTLRFLHR